MRPRCFFLTLFMLVFPTVAQARTTLSVSYSTAEVWPSAVRFLRVDKGYPIREKDDGAGYILFDLAEGNRTYKASLEFIQSTDSQGRESTRIAASVPDLPRHFEQILLDRLSAKIREDRGNPRPQPAKKPQPNKDAGP